MTERQSRRGIVVGADGSPTSLAAARWAAGEAAMRHVPLTVVHVVAPATVAASALAWPTGRVPQEVLESQEARGRLVIEAAVEAAADGVDGVGPPEIATELLFGGVVSTFVRLSGNAELVVIGSRGHAGRLRRLLGSVGTGLLHHAHGPVAVVHDEAQSAFDSAQRPVVLGVDGSRTSESATAIAFEEASRRGVELLALHVWSDADMSTVPGSGCAALKVAADKTLAERLAGWQERWPEVTIRRVVEYDEPVRHLLDHAQRSQLLVVGSHGRGGFTGMALGSVSLAVAVEARVPVLVARRQGKSEAVNHTAARAN